MLVLCWRGPYLVSVSLCVVLVFSWFGVTQLWWVVLRAAVVSSGSGVSSSSRRADPAAGEQAEKRQEVSSPEHQVLVAPIPGVLVHQKPKISKLCTIEKEQQILEVSYHQHEVVFWCSW